MFKRLLLIPLVCVTALLLFGCGGGSSSDQPLTKKEYLQQGSAICEHTLEEEREALTDFTNNNKSGNVPTAEQEQFFTEQIFPRIENAIEEFKGLTPPPKDRAAVNEFIRELEAGLAQVKQDPSKFAAGKAFVRANKGARIYGLSNCVF